MKTWEMLKLLTENNDSCFKLVNSYDEPVFCFLENNVGSIEFRSFRNWDDNYICSDVIIYPDFNWVEISKGQFESYLRMKNIKL